jgi:hypothetical protein
MPKTKVVFYKEDDGSVPILEWLDSLQPKALDKCTLRIERLKELGHELRRPESDFLRDGIYELRVGLQHVNYRMFVFFSRQNGHRGFARLGERGGSAAQRN